MSEPIYSTQRLDHLGILAGICHQIDLVGQIDRAVGPQERDLTVGESVQSMVFNALGFSSRPLYLTPEFFHNKPLDILFERPGLTSDQFNDDSLGRALDRLYETGVTEVFATVAGAALRVFGIETDFYHLDSTSLSFFGEYTNNAQYEEEDDEPIQITHGHSKDHRPDLKQAVLSLICAHRSTLPVWMEALSGNTSDKESFPKTISAFCAHLGESQRPFFVVDSALYARETLPKLKTCKWLTRVPATLKAVKSLYQTVSPETMAVDEETGDRYHELTSDYGGVAQRWVLVYSEPLFVRQERTFEKKKARALKGARKAWKKLRGQSFECASDARSAAESVSARWSLHRAQFDVVSKAHYDRPGRPGKNQVPDSITWHLQGAVEEDADAIARARRPLGKFVLATNELDAAALPVRRILPVYRSQAATVERGFRFLKDPMFFAQSFYLHKPERVMALMMVMCLSLLVYALAERALQQGLEKNEAPIYDREYKIIEKLSLRRVFQIFEGIDILTIITRGTVQRMLIRFGHFHRDITRLLGPHVEKLYAGVNVIYTSRLRGCGR
jgi:transposase